MAYGNAMGMLTIRCDPFTSKGENFFVKLVRSGSIKQVDLPSHTHTHTHICTRFVAVFEAI